MFLHRQCAGFKIEGRVSFIKTDGTSAAKHQVKLTTEEKNILTDIHQDPSQSTDGDNDDMDFDDTFVNRRSMRTCQKF